MSLLKTIESSLFSLLFVISLYVAITSYTMGNLAQKSNVESFIQSQLKESIAPSTCEEMCSNEYQKSCEEYCNNLNNTNLTDSCINACLTSSHNLETKQACIQTCVSRSNESQQYVSESIDELYSSKIAGISLNDIAPLLENNILFIVLSVFFGFLVIFVSEKPVLKTGNNIIWVGITLLSIAVVPTILVSSESSVARIISDYIMQSLYNQTIIGVILLAIGIVLIFVGKKKGK